jgi:hypothetical protein
MKKIEQKIEQSQKKDPPAFTKGVTLFIYYKWLSLGAGGGNRTRVSSLEG